MTQAVEIRGMRVDGGVMGGKRVDMRTILLMGTLGGSVIICKSESFTPYYIID